MYTFPAEQPLYSKQKKNETGSAAYDKESPVHQSMNGTFFVENNYRIRYVMALLLIKCYTNSTKGNRFTLRKDQEEPRKHPLAGHKRRRSGDNWPNASLCHPFRPRSARKRCSHSCAYKAQIILCT